MSLEQEEVEEVSEGSEKSDRGSTQDKGPKFWVILKSSTSSDRTIEPQHYLAAIAELLALTIVCSLAITWTYERVATHCWNDGGEQLGSWCPLPFLSTSYFKTAKNRLSDNPIRNMVGYNNPCAFWDQPPALYFASFMFLPMVYFAFRYAITDTVRAHLVMQKNAEDENEDNDALGNYSCACLTINWIYAASQCIVMGIFVITPHVYGDHWPTCHPSEKKCTAEELEVFGNHVKLMHWKMRAHSACFLQFVPTLCITMAANYFEAHLSGIELTRIQWAVLAFYMIATTMETIFASTAIFLYQGDYSQLGHWEDNFVYNKYFMQCIDYTWFLSLPLASHFQPPSPDLRIFSRLADDEQTPIGTCDDAEVMNLHQYEETYPGTTDAREMINLPQYEQMCPGTFDARDIVNLRH